MLDIDIALRLIIQTQRWTVPLNDRWSDKSAHCISDKTI